MTIAGWKRSASVGRGGLDVGDVGRRKQAGEEALQPGRPSWPAAAQRGADRRATPSSGSRPLGRGSPAGSAAGRRSSAWVVGAVVVAGKGRTVQLEIEMTAAIHHHRRRPSINRGRHRRCIRSSPGRSSTLVSAGRIGWTVVTAGAGVATSGAGATARARRRRGRGRLLDAVQRLLDPAEEIVFAGRRGACRRAPARSVLTSSGDHGRRLVGIGRDGLGRGLFGARARRRAARPPPPVRPRTSGVVATAARLRVAVPSIRGISRIFGAVRATSSPAASGSAEERRLGRLRRCRGHRARRAEHRHQHADAGGHAR